jgi:hypothetical protein
MKARLISLMMSANGVADIKVVDIEFPESLA